MKKKNVWITAGVFLTLLMCGVVWAACASKTPNAPSESSLQEFQAVVSDVSGEYAHNEYSVPQIQTPVDESWQASEEPTVSDEEEGEGASIEEFSTSEIDKENDSLYEEVSEDYVIIGEKESDTVQIGPTSGEDRNDEILKGKEEKAPVIETEPPIVAEREESRSETPPKEEVMIEDEFFEGTDSYQPEYNPSIGGENPFDSDSQTEIDDVPVEDYIGEGEDRPGEGIQF